MGETADSLRQQIDDQRSHLTENVEELEERARAMTDWEQQFRERPEMFLGAALAGGVLLGALFGGGSSKSGEQPYYYDPQDSERNLSNGSHDTSSAGREVGRNRASSKLDDIQGALISVAATKLEEIVREAIPGFGTEISRVRSGQDSAQRSDPPTPANENLALSRA